jgi:hypothetical protein
MALFRDLKGCQAQERLKSNSTSWAQGPVKAGYRETDLGLVLKVSNRVVQVSEFPFARCVKAWASQPC